jgi:crotonobetainyl-CoA:carnitine CoA-transferase CaiB-like acyl-CoA transferase
MSLLGDLRVIDLTDPSGVFATRLLADLGADVIRVEPPDGGRVRRHAPFVDGEPGVEHAYYHQYHNAGKRSAVLDFAREADMAAMHGLLAGAQVLVESGPPGGLARFGLDHPSLAERYPALVRVSISPFGQTGPWAARRSADLIAAAAGGILGISGGADEPPIQGAADTAWKMAGLLGATGAVIGWFGARRGGQGAWVDISVHEAATMMVAQTLNPCLYTLEGKVPGRQGFYGPFYRCADGRYISAGATQQSLPELRAWAAKRGVVLAEEEGGPVAAVMAQVAACAPADEVMALVEDLGVVGLPIGRFEDFATNAHFVAFGQFAGVRSPALGTELSFSRSPVAGIRGDARPAPAPALGEHTAEVLAEIPRRPAATGPATGPAAALGEHTADLDPARPLAGLRILDFTWVLAGPLGTRILANFGAEVIRVESAARPDSIRRGGRTPNTAGLFNDANTGKMSISLDLTRPEAVDLAKRLSQQADVVINNFRPGVLDRMGLGYEVLRAVNPGIVVVHMPGCGVEGPWASRPTFGNIVMAASGLNEISGFEGSPPWGLHCAYPDFTSPYLLVLQILAAIRNRESTGEGREIVIDQLSAMVSLLGAEWMRFTHEGRLPRNANRNPNYCPHGVYPVAGEDRWIAIAVEDDDGFAALARRMGRPELAADRRFADHAARKRHEDPLDEILREWTPGEEGWRLADELQAAGVAAAMVERLDEMIERDPQLAHRGHYRQVVQPTDPDIVLTIDREAIDFVGVERPLRRAPALGEHNLEIFSRPPLSLTPEQIESLAAAGVIR